MDPKLQDLLKKIEQDVHKAGYEIKWVYKWQDIGTVDSCIFDTYEEATENKYNHIISPILVERED